MLRKKTPPLASLSLSYSLSLSLSLSLCVCTGDPLGQLHFPRPQRSKNDRCINKRSIHNGHVSCGLKIVTGSTYTLTLSSYFSLRRDARVNNALAVCWLQFFGLDLKTETPFRMRLNRISSFLKINDNVLRNLLPDSLQHGNIQPFLNGPAEGEL